MRYFKFNALFSLACENAVNNLSGIRFTVNRKTPRYKAFVINHEALNKGAGTHFVGL